MASVLKVKRSSVQGKAPSTNDLQSGELALNTRDGKLFSSDGSSVFEIGANNTNASIGTLTVGNTNPYTFPNSDGNDGQILTTDGSGNLSFTDPSTSSGFDRDGFTTFIHYSTKKIESGIDFGLVTDTSFEVAFGENSSLPIFELQEPIGRTETIEMGSVAE